MFVVFFFSSRRRHTRYWRDWSSDVCSSDLEKILLKLMSKSVLPIFSSKRLIVSGLIFRSLIHFEFILVCGEKEWSIFNLLHVAVQFSQHHLLKRLSFLHCRPSAPLSKISCP